MYARTVPGPEKQPLLREFLDEPDTPLDIRVPPPPGAWGENQGQTSNCG